ncbi:hypothetical protein GCM10011504_08640 [Siccirubricoccus deserti]|uniref:Uncharacterized protein n=1 Tax=Siccirubricoccus deserti TaxID=2013562 RepID=A0A9X0QV20_9PROT|nr:hypothetical protein [Siccirubricoccus deserti]MBC4014461.1 hypothetical protein [Siccirubricoccus deserti]GGC32699.1 hypothetical protein GCM10011504_08640 [Siccirubricoccus deserti]
MADKQSSGQHQKAGGQPQGQQQRGQMSHDDRRQESGRMGGEPPRQDEQPGKRSQMEREKANKGKGSPA